jgi:hypothetical protein
VSQTLLLSALVGSADSKKAETDVASKQLRNKATQLSVLCEPFASRLALVLSLIYRYSHHHVPARRVASTVTAGDGNRVDAPATVASSLCA